MASANTTVTPSSSYSTTTETYYASMSSNTTNVTSTVFQLSYSQVTTTVIPSSSTAVTATDRPASNSSGGFEGLFSVVFISCVSLSMLFILFLFLLIGCWGIHRRKRVSLTDRKPNPRRSRGVRPSLKGTFVSDGPLYAVSNLNGSRYTGIPRGQQTDTPVSTQPSSEIDITENTNVNTVPGEMNGGNQVVIYQRYLTPIHGLPEQPVSTARQNAEESSYLQPVGGFPVPDGTAPKLSRIQPSPKPSPKPNPKPALKRGTTPQPNQSLKDAIITAPPIIDLSNTLYDEVVPREK